MQEDMFGVSVHSNPPRSHYPLITHNGEAVGGVRVTYGLRTTAEQLCQTDFETGDRSLLYLTPGIFEQKYRNCQCVKMGETKRVIGTSQISHSFNTL